MPARSSHLDRIVEYDDLVHIKILENDEPLVVIQERVRGVTCAYEKLDMLPITGQRMFIRRTVALRLHCAAMLLGHEAPGVTLMVVYAWRHPHVQALYHEARKHELRGAHPDWDETKIRAAAHVFSAAPEVAGHPTGAAIDVCLLRDGRLLDMGTRIAEFTNPKIATFASGLTEDQMRHRAVLRRALMAYDFAPFNGEWWHFSYGDREWAAYYGHPHAIYGEIANLP